MNYSNKVSTSKITTAIIDLIKNHITARTTLTQNANVGDSTITVRNAFQFKKKDEIVLIDNGYNNIDSPRYQQLEYAVIKEVVDVNTIILKNSLGGEWLISEGAAVQKTIAHSPLFPDNILYGDREVIPTNEMAITVETSSMSNEWIYLEGGLSEDYKVRIMVYGKSVKSEEGRIILDRYSDAIYTMLNENIHIDIDNIKTPILQDIPVGGNKIYIEKTEENEEYYVTMTESGALQTNRQFVLQDAHKDSSTCHFFDISSVDPNYGFINGVEAIELTTHEPIQFNYTTSNYAILIRWQSYIYDSRVDSINFGQVFKGSAVLRASEINWFGKIVNEHSFPQKLYSAPYFDEK